MKTLLLLRHAKSSWSQGVASDHDRPLNGRGERAAPLMGRLIRHHELVPDIVVTSTAVRAKRTADLVADACGYQDSIHTNDDLYHASTAEWLSNQYAIYKYIYIYICIYIYIYKYIDNMYIS